jgi:hypothetical protein
MPNIYLGVAYTQWFEGDRDHMYKARSFIPPLGGLFRLEGEKAITFDGVSLLYFSRLTYESIFLDHSPGESSLSLVIFVAPYCLWSGTPNPDQDTEILM